MKRQRLTDPSLAAARPFEEADQEWPEPASERRDRWPISALRPTVYCPSETIHQCVAENR